MAAAGAGRGITIGSAAVVCGWKDVQLTLIDTPGHVDFSIEVSRALTVLDGAVVIISACDGVQSQTQTVWHQAAQYELPALGFINKLDRPGYNHDALMEEIEERLGIAPLPLQIPSRFGGSELALLDVLQGRLLVWRLVQKKAGVRAPEVHTIDDEYHELLRQDALEQIADAVADFDDDFAERYLAGEPLPPERWLEAIKRATLARQVLPLVFGVARSGVGPDLLLDAVLSLLPTPEMGQKPRVFDAHSGLAAGRYESALPAALVFKTESRGSGKRVAHVRVFSGRFRVKDSFSLVPEGPAFKVQQLVRLMGSEELEVPCLEPGTVGALILGPEAPRLRTGQTLTTHKGGLSLTFESILIPTPVISVSLEADDEEEDRRMRLLLEEAVHDDPSLAILHDRDSGQTLLAGMGELHLELVVERLQKDELLRCRVGQPRARWRRMIASPSQASYTHVEPGSVRGVVEISIQLRHADKGDVGPVAYRNEPALPATERRALEAGILHALVHDADLVAVVPVVTSLQVSGGAVNPRMLWDAGYAIASAAVNAAELRPAEPWMKVTLTTPEELVGRVSGDLARRRAKIHGSESRGAIQVLYLEAPLAEMIHYATALRSLTAGRGTFSMRPSRFRMEKGMAV